MEFWDQVQATDEAVAAGWARLVIDRWHHRDLGLVIHTDEQFSGSSSVVALQKMNGQVQGRGSGVRSRVRTAH